jgi:hypothetical protein
MRGSPIEIFHREKAVEIQFTRVNNFFYFAILQREEIDYYYLPLIKRPILATIIGMKEIKISSN